MRRDRPHQGAQLRFEDIGDYRPTAFTTQHEGGSARRPQGPPPTTSPPPGDRIGCAKDTRLNHFPLQSFAQNRIWSLNVTLACNLLAFSQLLALTSTPARAWKPRTIRLRLISPRYHRPPRPPHRPALQDRPPLD